jgi:hypothetical protein
MIMPQLPGSSPATVTEENEETDKGEDSVSCFFNYFINPAKLLRLCSVE